MSLELALKGLIHEVLVEAGVIKSLAGESVTTEAATPVKRGRGRPVVGEAPSGAAAATVSTAPVATSPTTDDPFAAPATPAAPTATLDEVRAALTALKTATSQDNALKVLKDAGGADNLTSLTVDKYGTVVAAAKNAIPATKPTAVVELDDPFAIPASSAPAAKPPTLEEVKALIVETQKRTSQDTVQKVVMEHGGKAKNPDTGIEGPSLKALPVEQYAAVAAKLKALPSTK